MMGLSFIIFVAGEIWADQIRVESLGGSLEKLTRRLLVSCAVSGLTSRTSWCSGDRGGDEHLDRLFSISLSTVSMESKLLLLDRPMSNESFAVLPRELTLVLCCTTAAMHEFGDGREIPDGASLSSSSSNENDFNMY